MRTCCSGGGPSEPAAGASIAARRSGLRRIGAVMGWIIPITALAIVPKCPACVAAYVLLLTGVGLSLPAATAMRWVLIAVCIAALACLLVRSARRALASAA